PQPIPVALRLPRRGALVACGTNPLRDLEFHQGLDQKPQPFPQFVHLGVALVFAQKLQKCHPEIGHRSGHSSRMGCLSNPKGTGRWPLLSMPPNPHHRRQIFHHHGGRYWLTLTTTLGLVAANGLLGWVPTYLTDELGQDRATAGLITGLILAGQVLGVYPAGIVSDRIGRRKPVLYVGTAGMAVSLASLLVVR